MKDVRKKRWIRYGNQESNWEKEETEEKKNSVMPLAIGFIGTASIIGIGLYIYKRRND